MNGCDLAMDYYHHLNFISGRSYQRANLEAPARPPKHWILSHAILPIHSFEHPRPTYHSNLSLVFRAMVHTRLYQSGVGIEPT